MSDNIGIKGVRGIVYACILRDSKDYSSRPIVAGLLTFNDQKEMSWDQFRASGSHFGANLYCKTVIFQKETMLLNGALNGLRTAVYEQVSRYQENSSAPLPNDLPKMLSPRVYSPVDFLKQCIKLGFLPSNAITVGLASTMPPPPAPGTIAPNGAETPAQGSNSPLPANNPLLPSSNQVVTTAQVHKSEDDAVSNPSDEVRGSAGSEKTNKTPKEVGTNVGLASGPSTDRISTFKSASDSLDVISEAMSENGLDGVILEISDGGDFEITQCEDIRKADDALLAINDLHADHQQAPIIQKLAETIKQLRDSVKKEKKKNFSLTQENAHLDIELKTMQRASADTIIPGILPAVKQALSDVKKDFSKNFQDQTDEITRCIKDSSLAVEVESLRSSLLALSTKVAENSKDIRNTHGGIIKVDLNLSSLGMGNRGSNAPKLDIPNLISEVHQQAELEHGPLNLRAPKRVQSQLSSTTPGTTSAPFSTPINSRTSARNLGPQFEASASSVFATPATYQHGLSTTMGMMSTPNSSFQNAMMPNTGGWVDSGASFGNQVNQGQMMGGNVFQGHVPGNQSQMGGNQVQVGGSQGQACGNQGQVGGIQNPGQVGGFQGQLGGPVPQMPQCNYGPQGAFGQN